MNLLLKIVEGPNRGAEIALVEGVEVTLGKGDDCDIVLADPTLPGEPMKISASGGEVSVDGEPLAQFTVKTAGATSFAVGPADTPWGELKWPEREAESPKPESDEAEKASRAEDAAEPSPAEGGAQEPPAGKRRRGGCIGCLAVVVLVLAVLAVLAWLFRADPRVEEARSRVLALCGGSSAEAPGGSVGGAPGGGSGSAAPGADLAAVAAKYGAKLDETGAAAKMSGNFKTRRERLAATAEAYAAKPGVELDLSDDESFRVAADDAIFTLTEGALKVAAATNRVIALSGVSPSPFALKKTIEALNGDMPKLRSVDVSGVKIAGPGAARPADAAAAEEADAAARPPSRATRRPASAKAAAPGLPVCGILTTPYPCLVMKNGARLLEGASIGDSVILKIEADSVTLTNSAGRLTWRP